MIISVFDRVENIVGKGENADYQHFLLFPQCFEKASFPDKSKGVIVWEWVDKKNGDSMEITHQISLLQVIRKDGRCGSTVGCYHDCKKGVCSWLFIWNVDGETEKVFTFSAKQTGNRYAAVALSSDANMVMNLNSVLERIYPFPSKPLFFDVSQY